MTKYFLPLLVIFALTIFISWGSFNQSGMYFTHDSNYHLTRSMLFFNELQHGQFPVRMSADSAYSYGYLIWQFFYPLPAYLTSIFQLVGFNAVVSWKLMQALVTFFSLWFFYLWMRSLANKRSALTATTVYALVPFRFLTLYVTGQIGGYFAMMFIPLMGLSLHKLLTTKGSKFAGPALAVSIAGIITSHLISIILFFLPMAGYLALLLSKKFSWNKVKLLSLWSLLGLGLSSFYLLPFFFEKSWVMLGGKAIIRLEDHFPTIKQLIYSRWGFGTSVSGSEDDISFQIGLAILAVLPFSALILFKQKKKSKLALTLLSIFLALIFLMTQFSEPIWKIIVPLQYIQYPWRLLAATTLVGSLLLGWSLNKIKSKKFWIVTGFFLFLSFYNIRNYRNPWPLDWKQDSDYIQDTDTYFGSTDISWELLPVGAKQIVKYDPDFVLDATASGTLDNQVISPPKGNVRKIIHTNTESETSLKLALWDLPVWQIRLNGEVVEKQPYRGGTIQISLPAGENTTEVVLQKTLVQKISDWITFLSIIILIFVIFAPKNKLDKYFQQILKKVKAVLTSL